MPTMDLITEYVIRYGFQVLGAVLVFTIGAAIARWAGDSTGSCLRRCSTGSCMRSSVRAIAATALTSDDLWIMQ